jgi:hypothetical protein
MDLRGEKIVDNRFANENLVLELEKLQDGSCNVVISFI